VARHDLQAARTALQYAGDNPSVRGVLALKSPASGAVLRLLRDSEGVIMAGAPVLEVGDPAALEVVVDVLSSDAVQLQPGMAATLERWGGEPLAATVRRIEPVGFTRVSALGVDEQRVTVVLDIMSPPSNGGGWATATVWRPASCCGRATRYCKRPLPRYSGRDRAGRCSPCVTDAPD